MPGVVERIGAHGLAEEAKLPLGAVTLMAPLPEPRRIFGIAHNYRDALAERGMAAAGKPGAVHEGAAHDHRPRTADRAAGGDRRRHL